MPAVRARLQEVLGREALDQHINGDEGAVMGAAFYGASLAPGFRVKDFKVKDAIFTPIDVHIASEEPEPDAAELAADDEPTDKTAELWKAGSRLRSKKTLSFHTARNLTFEMHFAEGARLSGHTPALIGKWRISGRAQQSDAQKHDRHTQSGHLVCFG